jgi:hypothetical protein
MGQAGEEEIRLRVVDVLKEGRENASLRRWNVLVRTSNDNVYRSKQYITGLGKVAHLIVCTTA